MLISNRPADRVGQVARVFFETGSEQFKELENRVYVAAGRFLLEEGKPVVVEYKVSEVTV